jgi:hypothetical protein
MENMMVIWWSADSTPATWDGIPEVEVNGQPRCDLGKLDMFWYGKALVFEDPQFGKTPTNSIN